jgi:hypothetical protein
MRTKLEVLECAHYIPVLIALLMIASVPSLGQRGNTETIDATAFGTSTQLGRNFGVKIIIYEFSSPNDIDWQDAAAHLHCNASRRKLTQENKKTVCAWVKEATTAGR